MSQVATDHQNNTRTALEWVFQKCNSLQKKYDQIPDELRQYYVGQLSGAMANFSACDYKIEGNDTLNVDTFRLHLHGEMFDNGIHEEIVQDVRKRTTAPYWKKVRIEGQGTARGLFLFPIFH